MRIRHLLVFGVCSCWFSLQVAAQIPTATSTRSLPTEVELSEERVSKVIAGAELHFRDGKRNLEKNKRLKAREDFDKAMDAIIESGFDIRASVRLEAYYLELVERIYREEVPLQVPTDNNGSKNQVGFKDQTFNPSPQDELNKLILKSDQQPFDRNTSESKKRIPPKDPSFAGPKPSQLANGRVPIVVRYLNDNLHDPYSMKLLKWSSLRISYRHSQPLWYVTLRMRAKNGFGAYILREVGFFLKNDKVVFTENL